MYFHVILIHLFLLYRPSSTLADCGGDIEVFDKTSFSSPNYPNVYSNNLRCVWRIRTSGNRHLILKFETFSLEQTNDCVQIEDGNSLNPLPPMKYCGSNQPPDLISSGNTLFVTFVTDGSVTLSGFRAVVTTDIIYMARGNSVEKNSNVSGTDYMTTVYSIGENINDEFAYVHLPSTTSASVFTSLVIGDRIVDLLGHQENFEGWNCFFAENDDLKYRIIQPVNADSDQHFLKYYTFNDFTFFKFELVDCEIALQLILTPTEEPLSSQDIFYYITSNDCNSFNTYECTILGTDVVYINDEKFMCRKMITTFSIINPGGSSKIKWFMKQTEWDITIWCFRIDKEAHFLWSKVISNFPISRVNYFAIHALDRRRKKNILSDASSWDLHHVSSQNKELKGEWFTPVNKNMCITTVFYTKENYNDVLHIYIEQLNFTQTFMEAAGKSSKVGWQIENTLLTWPENIQNNVIRLSIKTLYNDIKIGKIYTSQMDDADDCTSGDNNILTLLRPDYRKAMNDNVISLTRTDYKGEMSALKVLRDQDLRNRKPVSFIHSNLYGGENQYSFTEHSCSPGFIGADCEEGCGINQFGTDCSILCSTGIKGCSGLLLCTQSVGCVCPPGYKGDTCEEECQAGFYGNNCSQSCGNCKESACDIYTGKCSSCQPGYYLPLCKYKYAVTSSPPHVNATAIGEVSVTPDFSDIVGKTTPEFYTVEYRKVLPYFNNPWIKYATLSMPENGEPEKTIIQGLELGIRYEVRIVLIDGDLSSYEEDGFVPTAEFVTQCNIPGTILSLQTNSNETTVTVSWQFENDETNNSKYWCPVKHYEVYWKQGWKWSTVNITGNSITVDNQLPGMTYIFKVRAWTVYGFTSYSPSSFVSTAPSSNITASVRNIAVMEKDSNCAYISWEPPVLFNNTKLLYLLEYKCILRPACQKNCTESAGEVFTTSTGTKISGLLPFSQYMVKVSASGGPTNNVIFATTMSDANEIPELHTEKLPVRTNTSIILHWKEPNICSGIIKNYFYQVYLEAYLLRTGITHNTNATIINLIPSTNYKIRVCIQLLSGRIHPDRCLEVNVSTTASVPEKVTNLTVYKQGRNMLGIRWARPERIQGTLKSFTVTTELNGVVIKSSTIEPTPCIIWPNLFCYSVTTLKANKAYTISVSARNYEINSDGPPTTVTGVTREKLPLAPENFKIKDVTSTTVTVQWDYPFVANGIIRSFVLNIEETDQFEIEKCCEIYPLTEISITDERNHYVAEVFGLKPASTYELSVSAKTIGLGPPQKLKVQTRPPQLSATQPNVTVNLLHENWQWQNISNFTDLYSYEVFRPLIKEPMLLLVVTNNTGFNETGIQDATLDNELKSVIPGSFYLTAEYTDETPDINIGDNAIIDGEWGKIRNIPLRPQTDYQLAAVRVTAYNGVYNAAISLTTIFTVS